MTITPYRDLMAPTRKPTTKRTPRAAVPPPGPNRAATLRTLEQYGIDAGDNALAALALTLADTLDTGAGSQVANVARELRMALDRLRELAPAADDEVDVFIASLGGAA